MALSVFPIAGSSPSGSRWFFVLVASVVALPSLVALLVVLWPGHVRFEVTRAGLTVRGSVYGRTIPTAAIRLEAMRRLSIDDTPRQLPKAAYQRDRPA